MILPLSVAVEEQCRNIPRGTSNRLRQIKAGKRYGCWHNSICGRKSISFKQSWLSKCISHWIFHAFHPHWEILCIPGNIYKYYVRWNGLRYTVWFLELSCARSQELDFDDHVGPFQLGIFYDLSETFWTEWKSLSTKEMPFCIMICEIQCHRKSWSRWTFRLQIAGIYTKKQNE